MAWLTLKQAADRGPSRATWERRIIAGRAPSYLNEHGRRLVWIPQEQATLEILYDGLQDVQRELRRVVGVMCGLKTAIGEVQCPRRVRRPVVNRVQPGPKAA